MEQNLDAFALDGTPFPRPLYPKRLDWNENELENKRSVEFALRIHNQSGGEVYLRAYDNGASWLLGMNASNAIHADGFQKSDKFCFAADGFPSQQRSAPISLQVEGGGYPSLSEDQFISSNDNTNGSLRGTYYEGKPCIIIFSPLVYNGRKHYGFIVGNSTLTSCNTYVVAVDRQGREVDPTESESSSGGGYTQSTVFFDPKILPRSQIAKLRFKARPFHWIEFDNVALYPRKAGQ